MPQKKPHKQRYAQLSESFLKYLRRHLVGFKHEPARVQVALLGMIMQAPSKFRQHDHYEGWARFHYQELEKKFGRGRFKAINQRLGVFHVHQDGGRDDWSVVEGRTKAYQLTDKVTDLRGKFLQSVTRRLTHLLTEDGDIQRTLPSQAVEAKGRDGQTRKGWKGHSVRTDVPVNQGMLRLLMDGIQAEKYAQEFGFQQSLFHAPTDPKYLEELDNEVRMAFHLTRNKLAFGVMPHRYMESDSGRLYAKGFNLQNAYRPVRQAALAGCYDYDIENCHYSILEQMAAKFGYQCQAIKHYLSHKNQVRQSLSADLGIKVKDAKQALIALVYGATFSEDPRHALPKLLGVEKAQTLYLHPLFLSLGEDVAAARSAILKGHTVVRQTIKNLRGLTMDVRKHDDKQQLAHLLQGVEAVALEAAHQLYPDHIVLLQHDGFTSTSLLDNKAIEEAIFQATGYRLEVPAGEIVVCQLDSALDDHSIKNQNEIMLQPSGDAGSSLSLVS